MTEQDELKWREQGRAAFLSGQEFESGPSWEHEPDASYSWAIGFQQAHGELHAEFQGN